MLSSAAQGVSAGLAQKYAGNYWIAKILSPTVYMLANASGKIVAKASVVDLKPYNRTFSQENAETGPAFAHNAPAGQRQRVVSELGESAEPSPSSKSELSETLAGAYHASTAFGASSAEAPDEARPASNSTGPAALASTRQSGSRQRGGPSDQEERATSEVNSAA